MNIVERWRLSLLKSIQLQLFISFISLSFLIGWGLPISLLTPVSTLIFGPFLSCFLLMSSLIFFCELLYLPNDLFIYCLEKITTIWLACLGLEQRSWLIGFPKPPIIVLLLIPILALAIIHSKRISSILQRIGYLGLFLVVTCMALKLFPYRRTTIEKIPCNKGEITLINDHNTILLIDPGHIASRSSYESLISYTLLPDIVQKTGALHIDHLIICKFNKRILDAVQFLATKITIGNLYIPAWKGRIPSFAWRSYAQLKKTILENKGKIMSLSYKKWISLDKNSLLSIEPVATNAISYYDATYQPLSVYGTIDDQNIQM